MKSTHAVWWASAAKFCVALVFSLAFVANARALDNHFRASKAARQSSGEANVTYLKAKRPPRAYAGRDPQQAARLNQLRGMGTLNRPMRASGSK
jgi:hypothetical protein